jgi:hypothetical protein
MAEDLVKQLDKISKQLKNLEDTVSALPTQATLTKLSGFQSREIMKAVAQSTRTKAILEALIEVLEVSHPGLNKKIVQAHRKRGTFQPPAPPSAKRAK